MHSCTLPVVLSNVLGFIAGWPKETLNLNTKNRRLNQKTNGSTSQRKKEEKPNHPIHSMMYSKKSTGSLVFFCFSYSCFICIYAQLTIKKNKDH